MKTTRHAAILACLIALAFDATTLLRADLTTGLIAYYPFNGNANDATGNGWNGTPVGGPTITSGIVGQAYYFDGVNDRISLPGSFLNSGLPEGTLCCWMRADSFHATYGRTIFNRGVAASSTALSLGVTWPPKLNAYINNQGPVTGISTLPTSQFLHVAFTWNGSRAKFYVNGAIDGDLSFTYSVPSGTSRTVDIGVDDQNVGWFHGIIDELRIYNRALSASEVQQLYATVQNPANGHYYEVVTTPQLSWPDAKAAAESRLYNGMHGHLVTITSQAENDFVLALVTASHAWIGGFRLDGGSPWRWLTGEPFSYSNWFSGEPNNPDSEHVIQVHGLPHPYRVLPLFKA